MLGFATVDEQPGRWLTVWLTTRIDQTNVTHTNAVVFESALDPDWALAEQMIADHALVLTDRTDRSFATKRGVTPVDISILTKATLELQNQVLVAWEQERLKPNKTQLSEPALPPPPQTISASGVDPDSPSDQALAMADFLAQTWRAWIQTERERSKRRNYMPQELKSNEIATFPADFGEQLQPVPIGTYRRFESQV